MAKGKQQLASSRTRIYLETSIVNYLVARPSRDVLAAGRQDITREWWEGHIADFDVFVSG
jgi:hypothetical protein